MLFQLSSSCASVGQIFSTPYFRFQRTGLAVDIFHASVAVFQVFLSAPLSLAHLSWPRLLTLLRSTFSSYMRHSLSPSLFFARVFSEKRSRYPSCLCYSSFLPAVRRGVSLETPRCRPRFVSFLDLRRISRQRTVFRLRSPSSPFGPCLIARVLFLLHPDSRLFIDWGVQASLLGVG